MSKFVDGARDQAFLLAPDLRDWIPEDDLAHFVIEAVERVEIGAFGVKPSRHRLGAISSADDAGAGDLLLCQRDRLEPAVERATRRDIGVRFVAGNSPPDHDTIATFRRENFAAVAESFWQVLLLPES